MQRNKADDPNVSRNGRRDEADRSNDNSSAPPEYDRGQVQMTRDVERNLHVEEPIQQHLESSRQRTRGKPRG
jgi:hypothetical protein